MIITISNQKAGGGKTTTGANLAVLLARQDRRVLAIDSDRELGRERFLAKPVTGMQGGRRIKAIARDRHPGDRCSPNGAICPDRSSRVARRG